MKVHDFFVHKEDAIINGVRILDEIGKKIILVVDNERLVGVVTDGDIRRWILQNRSLGECIEKVMNPQPIYIKDNQREEAKNIFLKRKIEALPVVDNDGKVVDIIFFKDSFEEKRYSNDKLKNVSVVIMAGGKGTRLYPYTKVLPKPLIPIGEQTILERIMHRFMKFGCNHFYLTVNYKKNMIKAYLEECKNEVQIEYVEEEQFLGTGGSLYLLKDTLKDTFIMSNCDILVDADYADIIQYHKKNGYKITMVTSLKNYTIPYGVIEVAQGGSISEIIEKPQYNFQVNTGLYILEPEILKDIPENTFFHITDLINKYVAQGEKVGVYPIMGNAWLDMGEIKEMETMISKLKVEQE